MHSDAVLCIYEGMGFPWRLASLFRVIPAFLRDPVYRLIARNRYRAKHIAAKLSGLLTDKHVAGACKQVAARIKGVDALGQACDLIEQLSPERAQAPAMSS